MNIIPLLQEYFYEDYEKIRLVLGDSKKSDAEPQFIKATKTDYNALFGTATLDLDEGFSYEINDSAFDDPQTYLNM